MKKMMLLFTGVTVLFSACNTSDRNHKSGQLENLSTSTDTNFISRDTANKMINSYLNSINVSSNDTDLRAFVVNADELKKYLDTEQNITQFKIFFAHTLSYINGGHTNQPAGYKAGALTIIIAGVNSNGDYVYYPSTTVLDNSAHCPTNCPSGSAGNNTLTLPSAQN